MFKVETTVFWIYGEADSFADELVRDLFNRKMQERVHLLPILKAICPNGQIEGNMFVSDWLRVFLDEGPCGFWITKSPDERSNPMDVQFARRAGATSLESYACMHLGYTTRMAFKELARRGNDSASQDERYLYSFKPRCSLVRAFEALRSKKYPREEDPLRAHGFVLKSTYSYVTLDNKVVYFVCYFQSPEGEIVKLPLTLWSTPSGKLIFDWLHPFAPFPLYRWNLLYGKSSPVLICEDEAQVEYLREKHAWLLKQACLTTWSGGRVASIDGTDWGALGDRCVGIIVSPSAGGYKTANKLYRAMKRSGVGPIGFLMPWARLQADQASANAMMSALDEDVTESMLKRHEVADRIEFVKDARERFGLDFEPDLVEAAISGRELLALLVSDAEVVLGPMIMRGDKVMLYAHRGSGKTWLISFIAVACASGGSLFGGRLKAPNPLRVLVIDGEMGARELQKRYSMIFKAMGTPKHLQDNLRFIAARIQGREIQLETPEERERFREDIAWADVIIADSVFCLFPGAMGSQLEGAQGFNEFMRENSLKEKTTIAVDHTGKSKSNSYGTIGKELGLELVLQVEKVKKVENSELFRLSVKKHRNLGSKDTQPIEYQLIVDEGAGVAELVFMSTKSKASASKDEGKACKTSEHLLSEVECDADADNVPSLSGDKPSALLLDELNMKIIAALEADPGLSVRALAAKVGASKGTADNRRKKLEQAGLVWPKVAPVDEGEFEVDDDEA